MHGFAPNFHHIPSLLYRSKPHDEKNHPKYHPNHLKIAPKHGRVSVQRNRQLQGDTVANFPSVGNLKPLKFHKTRRHRVHTTHTSKETPEMRDAQSVQRGERSGRAVSGVDIAAKSKSRYRTVCRARQTISSLIRLTSPQTWRRIFPPRRPLRRLPPPPPPPPPLEPLQRPLGPEARRETGPRALCSPMPPRCARVHRSAGWFGVLCVVCCVLCVSECVRI